MAADGDEKKTLFLFIFFDPDQRVVVVKGSLLLKRTGEFAGPAARADLFIDLNHSFPP
jgi:hypothetical protein